MLPQHLLTAQHGGRTVSVLNLTAPLLRHGFQYSLAWDQVGMRLRCAAVVLPQVVWLRSLVLSAIAAPFGCGFVLA